MEIEDEAAYTAYVEKAWPTLVRAAVFLGAGVHEAEELAQQTLVRCYGAWDRVSAAGNRDAYVYRMLLNCLRDQRRSRWWKDRRDVAQLDTPTPDRSEAVATADAIHRALAGLTKPARDVVVLRYFVELSEAQTAQALGIPAGTVKSRLSRALTQLAADDHLLSFKA
ncbi:MAG TPA: SigE family RNA polymerase sigma factor [Nocardioides sp.]|nr:SigE family RNA polymerase sigma factor [Nocardioides sp.]